MHDPVDVLWLNTSDTLNRFNLPLVRHLAQQVNMGQWQYSQTQDEPSQIDIAVALLHDYLQTCNHPIHLVGHGISGVVGLLYARLYPQNVRSLTLLSVAAYPMTDWVAHYYFHRHLLNCCRTEVLKQMVLDLFGNQPPLTTQMLANILEKSLDHDLSGHSLWQTTGLPPDAVPVPLLVCGSQDDVVVDTHALQGWQPFLKPSDRIWQCPRGYHFFQCFYPQQVGAVLLDFWSPVQTALQPAQVS